MTLCVCVWSACGWLSVLGDERTTSAELWVCVCVCVCVCVSSACVGAACAELNTWMCVSGCAYQIADKFACLPVSVSVFAVKRCLPFNERFVVTCDAGSVKVNSAMCCANSAIFTVWVCVCVCV